MVNWNSCYSSSAPEMGYVERICWKVIIVVSVFSSLQLNRTQRDWSFPDFIIWKKYFYMYFHLIMRIWRASSVKEYVPPKMDHVEMVRCPEIERVSNLNLFIIFRNNLLKSLIIFVVSVTISCSF